MTKKNIISILCFTAFGLALFSCKKDSNEEDNKEEETKTTSSWTIKGKTYTTHPEAGPMIINGSINAATVMGESISIDLGDPEIPLKDYLVIKKSGLMPESGEAHVTVYTRDMGDLSSTGRDGKKVRVSKKGSQTVLTLENVEISDNNTFDGETKTTVSGTIYLD